MNELDLPKASGFEMKPRTLDEAMKCAEMMASSDLVPAAYKGKPANVLVAIQLGMELGMTPMRALRSVAVVNGRATLYGDDLLAMVLNSPLCEYVDESLSTPTCGVCKAKRKGGTEHVSTFTLEDAKRAGLLGKAGPWQQYTGRMLKLRARGFCLRDVFADVLAGLVSTEEALDIPPEKPLPTDVTPPKNLKERLKEQLNVQPSPYSDSLEQPSPVHPIESVASGDTTIPEGTQMTDTPDSPDVFREASAMVDWEVIVKEVEHERLQETWDAICNDGRLSGPQRAKLYKRVQARKQAKP